MHLTPLSEVLPAVVPSKPRSLSDLIILMQQGEAFEHPDVVLPMHELRLTHEGTLAVPSLGAFGFTDWSKKQLSSIVGVRWDRWFGQMSAEEQADEVNKRLRATSDRIRVRTMGVSAKPNGTAGTVTALVSSSFTPLPDSRVLELLQVALEPVEPDLPVIRFDRTDRTTTYVIGVGRPFRPGDSHDVGDVWGGLTIRNSGVGYAAALIVASFTRLLCKNGMTAPVPGAVLLRRTHRAFDLEKLREHLVGKLKGLPGKLGRAANALLASRDSHVTDAKAAFLEFLKNAHLPQKLLPEFERAYAAEPAIAGSQFGIAQAITRAAQHSNSEQRFELERAAGEYLTHLSYPEESSAGGLSTQGEPS